MISEGRIKEGMERLEWEKKRIKEKQKQGEKNVYGRYS